MSNIHWRLQAKERREAKYARWLEEAEKRFEANRLHWIEFPCLPYARACWPVDSNRHDHYKAYYLNELSEKLAEEPEKYPGISKHSCGNIHPIEYHISDDTKGYIHVICNFLTSSGAAARYARIDPEYQTFMRRLALACGVTDFKFPPPCCGERPTPFNRHSYEQCPETLYRLCRIDADLANIDQEPEMFDPSARPATLNCGDSPSCPHKETSSTKPTLN